MNTVNLIPAARQAHNAERRVLRRWITICATYFLLLCGLAAVAPLVYEAGSIESDGKMNPKSEISKSTARLAFLRSRENDLRQELESDQQVSDKPDWSILLAEISKVAGDNVILTDLEISQAGAAAHSDSNDVSLRIEGIGQTSSAISSLIHTLQAVPVLKHVKLAQTTRTKLGEKDAYAFGLTCSVAGGSEEPHD